ncbi:MAG: CapA family protein [Elusimicrobiota bacterium]
MKRLSQIISILFLTAKLIASDISTATVTITAVGDVLLGYTSMDAKIKEHGVNYAFEKIADELRKADISICNYESCISTAGSPIKRKQFTFRCSPKTIGALKFAGLDVINIANNHAGDYGKDALRDTLKYLETEKMPYVGAVKRSPGRDKGVVLERNGIKVGFLGFSAVYPRKFWFGKGTPALVPSWPEEEMAERIKDIKKRADIVVISFHWGDENEFYPRTSQIYLARLAVDSGADVVLGHHPHVMQGAEIYKGKVIIYSLGNFVFFPPKEIGKETILAGVILNGAGNVEQVRIEPVYINDGQPGIATGDKGRELLEKYYLLCRSIGTDAEVNEKENTLTVKISTSAAQVVKYKLDIDNDKLKVMDGERVERSFKVYPGKDYPKKGKYNVLFFQGEWDRGYRFKRDAVEPVDKEFSPWFIRFSTDMPAVGINGLPNEVIVSTSTARHGSIGMSQSDINELRQYVDIGMAVKVERGKTEEGRRKQTIKSGSK